ncbi:hypothetical protein, partial [Escherichia coli]|uniref:hypothetical protein n=1 Tax=Escherichia coli TaxID=562 RepID=UPI001BE4CE1A
YPAQTDDIIRKSMFSRIHARMKFTLIYNSGQQEAIASSMKGSIWTQYTISHSQKLSGRDNNS